MNTRFLGNTGLQVSELAFGTRPLSGNTFGDGYGAIDEAEALRTLNRAKDMGCTLFDTADSFGHGHAETLLGKALKGWRREEVILSSQGGQDFVTLPETVRPNFSENYLRSALAASLSRLGTDYLDLYLLQTPSMELVHLGRMFSVLKALQSEGKIRFYGISIHDPMEGVKAIEVGQVQVIQAPYHLFDLRLEKTLLQACQSQGVGLMIREPLANGFLAGHYPEWHRFGPEDFRSQWTPLYINKRIQAANAFKPMVQEGYPGLSATALKWGLQHQSVSTVCVGCHTAAQVEENFAVSNLSSLSDESLKALRTQIARM